MSLKEKTTADHHNLSISCKGECSKGDLAYMSSLSSAVVLKSPTSSRIILWIILTVLIALIFWAKYAHIDELTRGLGKVIPSHQIQVVQNLEGGIVSDILVDEGELVEPNQVLIKIDDTSFSSSYDEAMGHLAALKAKSLRLEAEATSRAMRDQDVKNSSHPEYYKKEKSLFQSNKKQLVSQISELKSQKSQKKSALTESRSKLKKLRRSYKLMEEEVGITKPMVTKGIVSKVEFLQLQRKANNILGELEEAKNSIPRLKSSILEVQDKINTAKLNFQNKAKLEWNKTTDEMNRIIEQNSALDDKVKRTLVRSPVKGIIKRMLVNTINGVVQPGMDIVEIVPVQDNLLIETKIQPKDIAYLYPGQKALVRFTAYDFTIYGGLNGVVTQISADTIVDEKGESYYLVRIKTDKNYLEKNGEKMDIIVGMTANVDIITGKKSILEYMLKPIMKAKYNAFTER